MRGRLAREHVVAAARRCRCRSRRWRARSRRSWAGAEDVAPARIDRRRRSCACSYTRRGSPASRRARGCRVHARRIPDHCAPASRATARGAAELGRQLRRRRCGRLGAPAKWASSRFSSLGWPAITSSHVDRLTSCEAVDQLELRICRSPTSAPGISASARDATVRSAGFASIRPPARRARGRNSPCIAPLSTTRTAPPTRSSPLSATSSMPTVGPMTRSPGFFEVAQRRRSTAAPVRMTTLRARLQPAKCATSSWRREHDRLILRAARVVAAEQKAARQRDRAAAPPHSFRHRRVDRFAAARAHVAAHRLGEPDVERVGDQRVTDRRLDDLGHLAREQRRVAQIRSCPQLTAIPSATAASAVRLHALELVR